MTPPCPRARLPQAELHHLKWVLGETRASEQRWAEHAARVEMAGDQARAEVDGSAAAAAEAERQRAAAVEQMHLMEATLHATRVELGGRIAALERMATDASVSYTQQLERQLEAATEARRADALEMEQLRYKGRLIATRVLELEGSFGEMISVPRCSSHAVSVPSECAVPSPTSPGRRASPTPEPPRSSSGCSVHANFFLADAIKTCLSARSGDSSPALFNPSGGGGDVATSGSGSPLLAYLHSQQGLPRVSTAPANARRGGPPPHMSPATCYAHAFTSATASARALTSSHSTRSIRSAGTLTRPSTVPTPVRTPMIAKLGAPVARGAVRVASRRGISVSVSRDQLKSTSLLSSSGEMGWQPAPSRRGVLREADIAAPCAAPSSAAAMQEAAVAGAAPHPPMLREANLQRLP